MHEQGKTFSFELNEQNEIEFFIELQKYDVAFTNEIAEEMFSVIKECDDRKIVLNLVNLRLLSSSLLGILVILAQKVSPRKVYIRGHSDSVISTLTYAGLLDLFILE